MKITTDLLKQTFASYMDAWAKIEQDFPGVEMWSSDAYDLLPVSLSVMTEPTPEQIKKAQYVYLSWLGCVPQPQQYTILRIDYPCRMCDDEKFITINFGRKDWLQKVVQEKTAVLDYYKDLSPELMATLVELLEDEW